MTNGEKHTGFISGATWWDVVPLLRRVVFFLLLFLAASPAFVLASLLLRASFFLPAVSADPSLSDESTCTVFSRFPRPPSFTSLFFFGLPCVRMESRMHFPIPAPSCLYMCGRASFVFLCSRCLGSELKAIENGPKWRVSWCCSGDGRVLGCRKKTKKQKHFSSRFSSSNLCLWKVSWKAPTERRTSAFDGDLLPRTGTYTSFKMHSWLHVSPVRCRNILCWPLSRPRPLSRSWPAAVQMKRQPIQMKMSRGS